MLTFVIVFHIYTSHLQWPVRGIQRTLKILQPNHCIPDHPRQSQNADIWYCQLKETTQKILLPQINATITKKVNQIVLGFIQREPDRGHKLRELSVAIISINPSYAWDGTIGYSLSVQSSLCKQPTCSSFLLEDRTLKPQLSFSLNLCETILHCFCLQLASCSKGAKASDKLSNICMK